jgi:CRISPR-associated protein Csx14
MEKFGLKLSWWLRDDWSRFKDKPKEKRGGLMKTDLKFWAGNQSSGQLIRGLLSELSMPEEKMESEYFKPSKCISSRFGLDAGPAWTALNVGFSINEHPIRVIASAAVELLAAIGLQRCRPVIHEKGVDYAIWKSRLSPALLSAAVCGEIGSDSCTKYRTRIVDRGSYAAFCHSHPMKGGSRD